MNKSSLFFRSTLMLLLLASLMSLGSLGCDEGAIGIDLNNLTNQEESQDPSTEDTILDLGISEDLACPAECPDTCIELNGLPTCLADPVEDTLPPGGTSGGSLTCDPPCGFGFVCNEELKQCEELGITL